MSRNVKLQGIKCRVDATDVKELQTPVAQAEHIDLGIFRDTFIWAPLFVERLYESSESGSLSVVPKIDPLECLVSERLLAFATNSVLYGIGI